jgi:hypothetical protein
LPWDYKNQVEYGAVGARHPLLPHPVLAGKSVVRFWQCAKTVCFWQRLKQVKTEKSFAGQGAY